MCHSYDARRWSRATEEEDTEDDPAFLEDEAAEDVELLTDGGDGD